MVCKILVVDHNFEICEMLTQALVEDDFQVSGAASGREAMRRIETETPDIFLVNTYLPGAMDGLALCRYLRENSRTVNTPILFLTEQDSPYSVADALNAGGDDYLRKPFALRELIARIRAHLRRAACYISDEVPVIRIIPETLTVFVNNRRVTLTQVEFDLLRFLCSTPHQLHTTQDLLADVWQYPHGAGDAALVRNHIRNLRLKLEEDPDRPSIIQSRHGRGYGVKAQVHIGA